MDVSKCLLLYEPSLSHISRPLSDRQQLEYSSLNLCNLIGQLQVSKSHRDLQKRSLFNRDLSLRAFSLRDSI